MLQFILSAVVVSVAVAQGDPNMKPLPDNPAFNNRKSLVGEWLAEDDKGNPADQVVLVYRVVSAGSVIQESIFPGQRKEMVTMWAMDGNDLVRH